MAIMVIVMAFALPAFNSTARGLAMTQATQVVADQLHIARQTALTKNHPVEVRFYSYVDPTAPGSKNAFRAVQSFQMNDDGTFTAVGKVGQLPNSMVIDSNQTLSSIIGSPLISGSTVPSSATGISLNAPIPRAGTQYTSIQFHFLPDGSTNLPISGQPWFVTVHSEIPGTSLASLPPNFSTIQIDPYNGQTRIYRP